MKLYLPGKVIELGGGNNPRFHPNVDIREGPGVDIVANLEEPLPIEDKSYDSALCMYALEHLSWRKVEGFLGEIFRILRPGGKAFLITANLSAQAKVIAEKKEWLGDESCLIFGDQDYPENSHRSGFSPEYIKKLCTKAGFFGTKVTPHPDCPTDMIVELTKAPKNMYARVASSLGRLRWAKDRLFELIKDKPGAQVVDIGCYDCPITWDVPNCTWVDIDSYEKISKAMERASTTPIPRERFFQASADNLPFEDKQFEVALMTELLEHVDDPIKVLKEVKRVARHALITVPNEYQWSMENNPFCNEGHKRHYTGAMLREQFEAAGISDFTILKQNQDTWSFFNSLAHLGDTPEAEKPKAGGLKITAKIGEANMINDELKFKYLANRKEELKIALISTPFISVPPKNYGGLERVVHDLAWSLSQKGHQVTVFATEGSAVEGCEIVPFGPPIEKVGVDWLEAEKEAMSKVSQRIMGNGFDIIHGHNWFGWEYSLKAEKTELKVCHTHHGGLNLSWWQGEKPPWPLNMIALSRWMQKVYRSQGFQSRPIHNGIPLEDYAFCQQKGDRLLFVGRLDSFKRPHLAIELAKKLDLGLDIVGGSFVQDKEYMESIKKSCDGDMIRLYLDASQRQKVELYQKAKAVIFPSAMGEPFGLIAPEANACGTAVIASRDGAIPETVDDGVTGFICDSLEEMAEAVKKVDQISPEACRQRVERLFSRQVMAQNYLSAYSSILNGGEW